MYYSRVNRFLQYHWEHQSQHSALARKSKWEIACKMHVRYRVNINDVLGESIEQCLTNKAGLTSFSKGISTLEGKAQHR